MHQGHQGKVPILSLQENTKYYDDQFGSFLCVLADTTPVRTGISLIFSPRELLIQQKLDAGKWCKLMFGEYVEVNKENTITN